MAKSIWRRCPSSRISSQDLVKKNARGVSALVADDFFEYVPSITLVTNYIENRDISVNLPPSVLAGDLLLVMYSADNNTDPLPSGWFRIARTYGTGDGQTLCIIGKIAVGTESNQVLTPGVGDVTWLVYQYRGVDTAAPIGAVSTNQNNDASGVVSPDVSLAVPEVSTTTANSVVFALFGGDVLDFCAVTPPTYTYTTPSGFGNKLSNEDTYDTLCAFDKTQSVAGPSGSITCAMNTAGIMGIVFVINAVAGGPTVSRRAIIMAANALQEITDAQLGTGLKPVVVYNNDIVERSAAEGVPLVIVGNDLRELASGETLLI